MEVISSPDFWKFVVPLLSAVIAWFMNERQKRLADQYIRKEANYKALLCSTKGFYEGAEDAKNLKEEFLVQLAIAWLYAPDDVIRRGYAFIDVVSSGSKQTDAKKEEALGNFIVAIRQDLLSRKLVSYSSLAARDFKHLKST